MSNRVMSILRQYSPDQEVYSIDESFLDLTGFQFLDLTQYGQDMRKRILKWTGLPVCVGIGQTKNLSKLANHCAKKRPEFNSVCNFNNMSPKELNDLLGQVDVGEIWGVGRKLAPKLQVIGLLMLEVKLNFWIADVQNLFFNTEFYLSEFYWNVIKVGAKQSLRFG
jgi:DNA polymerase V